MKKYEYKTYYETPAKNFSAKLNFEVLDEKLNSLGAEGWELIEAATTNVMYGQTYQVIFVFKREIDE
jgi:hypothetical protein